MALPAECWRWYPGYVGLYQVSTRDRVRSVDRWVTDKTGKKYFVKGKILKPWRNKGGNLQVELSRNNKRRNFSVRRLVLEVWGDGNPEGKPQINHIDECKSNNVVLALPYECWRWVPGFEGLYQVSTRGRVRSVDRWVTYKDGKKYFYKGRILKQRRGNSGYLYVGLCLDGKQRHFLVHRLVAMAWLDNPDGKPEVNHLDETKNNDVYNLEWCTHIDNLNYGTGNKRRAASRLNGSLSKPVQALNPKTGQVVLEFPSASEAGRKGFNQGHLSACCRGEERTHKGFAWRYKE